MWYCTAFFISGKKKEIIFADEKEANKFYETIKLDSVDFVENKYDGILISTKNIETITKPKKYVAKS